MIWIPIAIGFFLLFCGAELLIRSAIQVARYFRFSKLVIGLTLVAFLTAAPEALISVFGHIQNNRGDIALSNVIGSNIANIGLRTLSHAPLGSLMSSNGTKCPFYLSSTSSSS